MKKKICLNSDSGNVIMDEITPLLGGGDKPWQFCWTSGESSIAGASLCPTGLRFDGRGFTVVVDNPGLPSESVKVLVNNVVIFNSVKEKEHKNDLEDIVKQIRSG